MLKAFEDAGYQIRYDTKKNRYYERMIDLLGGLEHVRLFRHEFLLRLFSNAMLKKGRAYTLAELKTLAAPKEETAQFVEDIQSLAGKQIFRRGFNVRCPDCDLEHWYPLADMREIMVCWGCGAVFQIPLQLDFAYRLNQLFIDGLNQGASTMLLTMLFLCEESGNNFNWRAGLLFERNGHTIDIDLVAECNGSLIFAECKNDLKGDVIEQLSRGIAVAQDCGATTYIFATLYEQALPQSFKDYLEPMERGQFQVRTFTRMELLNP